MFTENYDDEYKTKNIKKVLAYTLKNYLADSRGFSADTWSISWYIINVLRRHRPQFIRTTLTYCHGATKLIKEFMEQNIDFMVDMQFLRSFPKDLSPSHPSRYENLLQYLIEEQILLHKYKMGKLTDRQLNSKLFPIIIKKLENNLILRHPTNIKNVELKLEFEGRFYRKNFDINDLLDTKIVFPCKHERNPVNIFSVCYKKIRFDKDKWDTYTDFQDKRDKIKTISTTRSGGSLEFTLYELRNPDNGFYIGCVEFDYHDFSRIYGIEFIIL